MVSRNQADAVVRVRTDGVDAAVTRLNRAKSRVDSLNSSVGRFGATALGTGALTGVLSGGMLGLASNTGAASTATIRLQTSLEAITDRAFRPLSGIFDRLSDYIEAMPGWAQTVLAFGGGLGIVSLALGTLLGGFRALRVVWVALASNPLKPGWWDRYKASMGGASVQSKQMVTQTELLNVAFGKLHKSLYGIQVLLVQIIKLLRQTGLAAQQAAQQITNVAPPPGTRVTYTYGGNPNIYPGQQQQSGMPQQGGNTGRPGNWSNLIPGVAPLALLGLPFMMGGLGGGDSNGSIKFADTLDRIKETLGSMMSPALETLADWFDSMPEWAQKATGLTAALVGLGIALKLMGAGSLLSSLVSLGVGVKGVSIAITTRLIPSLWAAVPALWAAATPVIALLAPILLVTAAVAALGAVLYDVTANDSKGLRKFERWLTDNTPLADWGAQLDAALMSGYKVVEDFFTGPFVDFFSDAWGHIEKGWTVFRDWWVDAWGSFKEVASGLWSAVWDGITSTWGALTDTFSSLWTSLKDWFSGVWTDFSGWAGSTWTAVWDAITATWGAFKDWWGSRWDAFKGWWVDRWDALKTTAGDKWTSVWDAITSTWARFKGWWITRWIAFREWWIDKWEALRDKGKEKFKAVWGWIQDTWAGFVSFWVNSWTRFKNWWLDKWEDLKFEGKRVWDIFWYLVKKIAVDGTNGVLGTLESLTNKIMSFRFLPSIKVGIGWKQVDGFPDMPYPTFSWRGFRSINDLSGRDEPVTLPRLKAPTRPHHLYFGTALDDFHTPGQGNGPVVVINNYGPTDPDAVAAEVQRVLGNPATESRQNDGP